MSSTSSIPTTLSTVIGCEARNVEPFTLKKVIWSSQTKTKFVAALQRRHIV